jgi:predicted aspartyl protease
MNETWANNEGLFVKAKLQNKCLAFLIDTGANVTILSKQFIENIQPSLLLQALVHCILVIIPIEIIIGTITPISIEFTIISGLSILIMLMAFLIDTGANVTILSKQFIENIQPSLLSQVNPVNVHLVHNCYR